jgi:ribosomal protein S3AE
MAIKKKFIDVEIPAIETTIGVLGTPEELDKKTIKLDLSRKMKGKGIEIVFKIQNNDGKLIAFPKKIQLIKSYIQRMMRKRTSYVEDSFITSCKDIRIIIKPLLITRKKVSRAVRRNLRNTAKEFLIKYLSEKNYLEICDEILAGELQRTLLPKLKKVYPLSFSDIRIFETKELEKAKFPTIKKIEIKKPEAEEKSVPKEKPIEKPKKEAKKKEAKSEEKKEERKTVKKATSTKKKTSSKKK